MHEKVEKFLATLRDSFVGSQQVYTEGSCYHLHLLLKEVFPSAKPYYDADHIITEIDGRFYDITGEICRSTGMQEYKTTPSYSLKAPFNIYKIAK